jgi:cytochrome c556
VRKSVAAAILVAVVIAGCGGKSDTSVAPSRTTTEHVRTPLVRALIRDYKVLGGDVQAIRVQALKVKSGTLLGTPGLRRTTARFIEDLEKSHLSLKARNREIDHAAGAVATSCEQCFQQLEAVRPIPQIAHH